MSSRAPSALAVALGRLRYRLALAAVAFGLFMGWLLACIIPLCIYAYYRDDGGVISDTSRWALTASMVSISAGLTYRCRGWIARKALEEAPPGPVKIWSAKDAAIAGLQLAGLLLGVVGLLILLTAAAIAGFGGYLLLAAVSLPMAILIGAIVIALAIVAAAFRQPD